MRRILKLSTLLTCYLTLFLFVAGCNHQGPAEKAGEQIDEAIQETQQNVEEAVEESGEKIEEVGESIQNQ